MSVYKLEIKDDIHEEDYNYVGKYIDIVDLGDELKINISKENSGFNKLIEMLKEKKFTFYITKDDKNQKLLTLITKK